MLVLFISGLNHIVNIPGRSRDGTGYQILDAEQSDTAYHGCCLSQLRAKLVCFSSLWCDSACGLCYAVNFGVWRGAGMCFGPLRCCSTL